MEASMIDELMRVLYMIFYSNMLILFCMIGIAVMLYQMNEKILFLEIEDP